MFRELAAIYKKATGKRASITTHYGSGEPSGDFFRFMRAAVAPIPVLKDLKDNTLASAIKRAIT
jgi:hypothetical protein